MPARLPPFSSPGPLPPPEVPFSSSIPISLYKSRPRTQEPWKSQCWPWDHHPCLQQWWQRRYHHHSPGGHVLSQPAPSSWTELCASTLMLPLMTMPKFQAKGWPMCPVSELSIGQGHKSSSCSPQCGYSCQVSHPVSTSQLTNCPPLTSAKVERCPLAVLAWETLALVADSPGDSFLCIWVLTAETAPRQRGRTHTEDPTSTQPG